MECRVLLVPGSLRQRSTNAAVLRSARADAPDGVDAVGYDGLALLPAFNPDLDGGRLPGPVAALRQSIHCADALLFSVPEYAGDLPGAFKNLLDWTIGDDRPGSIHGKPVAWVNASARGATEAHRSLRRVLGYANAVVVEAACVDVAVTPALVGPDGLVTDHGARHRVAVALAALATHVAACTSGAASAMCQGGGPRSQSSLTAGSG